MLFNPKKSISFILYLLIFPSFFSPITLTFASNGTCEGEAYSAWPPFQATEVTPNVLFMIDNSGSMKNVVYENNYEYEINLGNSHYGIFDSEKRYDYDTTIPIDTDAYMNGPAYYGVTVEAKPVTTSKVGKLTTTGAFVENTNGEWSGDFLNWITTRKIDAARKVLVGGKVENREGFEYKGGNKKYWLILGNNEPKDNNSEGNTNKSTKSYNYSTDYGPLQEGDWFKLISPAHSGSVQDTYDPYAKLVIRYDKANERRFNIAVLVDEEPQGIIHDIKDDVRLGFSFYKYNIDGDIFHSWWHGGTSNLRIPKNPFIKSYSGITDSQIPTYFRSIETPIRSSNADNHIDNLVDSIEHYPLVWGTTPLSENFYEVIRYFQQKPPYYSDSSVNSSTINNPSTDPPSFYVPDIDFPNQEDKRYWDPYFTEEDNAITSCTPSSVIIFTDGASYYDSYVPRFNDEEFEESIGKLPATKYNNGTTFTNDYDGDLDGGTYNSEGFNWAEGGGYTNNLDDLAYWANHNRAIEREREEEILSNTDLQSITNNSRDLRPDIVKPLLDGDGNTITDNDGNAATYIENGLSGDQYLTTYTVGFGLTVGDWEEQLLDDTAIHGNGDFYATADGASLSVALKATFAAILNESKSGFGIATLSDDSSGSTISQTSFYPSQTFSETIIDINNGTETTTEYPLTWTGSLHSYWFYDNNIKEDNSPKFELNPTGDTTVDLSTSTSGSYNLVWDANDMLMKRRVDANPNSTDPSSLTVARRLIWGVDENNTLTEFTTSNVGAFATLLGKDDSQYDPCLGTGNDKYSNIISYIRGASDDFGETTGSCRPRATAQRSADTNQDDTLAKLGDIINSSPKAITYGAPYYHDVIYVGANDGMLHAFNAGYYQATSEGSDDDVAVVGMITDSKTQNNTTDAVGKELWALIPKNSMPYLRYLADPEYNHQYSVDGTPYSYQTDDGKIILIVGMRFGGATVKGSINIPADSSVGLSSYIGLDVTNPYEPKFLWEFSDDELGFTYSGPAIIQRTNKTYIVFLSGPNNYEGEAAQELYMYTMEVDEDFNKVSSTKRKITTGNAFGGRLFNNGKDLDGDGLTDILLYGVNIGGEDNLTGELHALAPTDDDPSKWENKRLLSTPNPIISGISSGKCFDTYFAYFGTGRWFHKTDSLTGDINSLYGVNLSKCDTNMNDNDDKTNCLNGVTITLMDATTSTECTPADAENTAWQVSLLEDGTYNNIDYANERNITDPTFSAYYDISIFTTTMPTSDKCELGGTTRLWALNCMTGQSMLNQCKIDTEYKYIIEPEAINILLPTSGNTIDQISIDPDSDDTILDENGASDSVQGTPGEQTGSLIPPSTSKGEILLWLER